MQTTLAIVKPDAFAAGHTGRILARLEEEGFRIRGLKLLRLSTQQARQFYAVHQERPFYDSLVEFMTSDPVVAVALERKDAVRALRDVMGATDPAKADEGTIRAELGSSIERNAIHGSDSPDNAAIEVGFFFSQTELLATR